MRFSHVKTTPTNRRPAMMLRTGAALLGSLAVLGGCSAKDDVDLAAYVEQIEPADVLYNQGLANLNANRLREASAKFEAVTTQHPYSEFSRKSMVMTAFTLYKQGRYDEAINAGKRFVALYPTDPEAAYAQYIVGLAYFRQVPDVTRDQRDTANAIQAMQEVIERYPESEYVADAESKIRVARDQLAGKEMQVGRYYLERREYIASVNRFRNVVENYSNTRHVEEALARLTEAYMAMGLVSEAQTAAAVLGHNFPDSPWYKDSYNLLAKGGVGPRENSGSWISRAAAKIVGA